MCAQDAQKSPKAKEKGLVIITYTLLHEWEGNMGKYSARGWQYWPDRREGQYRTRELNISHIATRPKKVQ